MNEKKIISAAMRILGKRTSAKKARSSRRNGRLAWSKRKANSSRAKSGKQSKIK